MTSYHYSLIRFVPDLDRVEPINVGLILQGGGRVDFKLYPHATKRKEIDTLVFNRWREFFKNEIAGDQLPLFQPDRGSVRFLEHLARLCSDTVVVARPLLWASTEVVEFDEVMNSLYRKLVGPPDVTSPTEAARPTGRFRQVADARSFIKRGLKRRSPIEKDGKRLWLPYRHASNGRVIAIDKVEVRNQLETTANEVERLPLILQHLAKFVDAKREEKPNEYYLVIDEMKAPFADQPESDFDALRDEFDQNVRRVEQAGGNVIRTVTDTESLANLLDETLPPLEPVASGQS